MSNKKTVTGAVPSIMGFVAPSGTGKTTLLSEVLRLLGRRGLRVGVIKQARDDFDVDVPGKDSYELRKAGVQRLLLASERRAVLILERPDAEEPRLDELLNLLSRHNLDLILAEGFSDHPFPKIELYREGFGPLRYPHDPWIIALATQPGTAVKPPIPLLDINDAVRVTDFVLGYLAESAQS